MLNAVLLKSLLLAVVCAACTPSVPPRDEGVQSREEGGPNAGDTLVSRAPVPDPSARDQMLAHLREGIELRHRGNAREAEEAFDRAISISPHFRDWTHVVAAMSAAAAKDSAGVRRRLERVRPGAAAEWGWRARTEVLREMGDVRGALRVAEHAAREVSSVSARAAAWAEVGALRRTAGDHAGAMAAFRESMRADRASAGALASARAAMELPALSPEDRLLTGRTLLAHGGTTRGVPALLSYLDSGEGTAEERRAVRLEAGRALFRGRDWEGAHRHLRPLASESAEAALLAARAEYRTGRRDEGRAALLGVARRFPRTDEAAEALFLVADLHHDSGRQSEARELYRQAAATGSNHVAATDAAVRLAGMAILARDARTALADLERFLAQRPRNARTAPAVYWLGRARQLAGDADGAAAAFRETVDLDPFSYYGGLAADRLGGSISATPLAPAPEAGRERQGEVRAALFRMDLLRDLEMSESASFEMELLRKRMGDSPEALYEVAEAMIARGQPIAGALLGREIQRERGAWDERLLRIVFQFPYRDLVEREARRNGLDPFMVAGLIRQESFFNPVAASPVGALGLMQVMPNTGRGLAARAGIRNFQPSMLREPEVNVRLGTLFLADQMRRWNGNPNDVFAAYNAGPNRVVRWRELPERADEDVYVERIPIAETRDYVKKVRFHTHVYRLLYSD